MKPVKLVVLNELVVSPIDAINWKLQSSLHGKVYHKDGELYYEIVVEPGFETDFASVPRFFQPICPVGRAEKIPAVFHDKICRDLPLTYRDIADNVFYAGLNTTVYTPTNTVLKTSFLRRNAMYGAVAAYTRWLKW